MHSEKIYKVQLLMWLKEKKERKKRMLQGDELEEDEAIYRANYWQGKFPDEDMGSDGFQYKTAPGFETLSFFKKT